MTVDLRAIIACDLGVVISGDVGYNHISDRSGLVKATGRLVMDGLVTPARGTAVQLLVACPQLGTMTRFPVPLCVIRSVSYPLENRSEVEVGCRLTLMEDLKLQENFFATGTDPISAQAVLSYCLSKVGISLYSGSQALTASFLRPKIDLSEGYINVIGQLIRSESCFGRLRTDGTLEIAPINLTTGGAGPILTSDDVVSFEPITTGAEPPDQFTVNYTAIDKTQSSDGTSGDGTIPTEEENPEAYWLTDQTFSPPTEVYIRYTTAEGVNTALQYMTAPRSISRTYYDVFTYTDAEGKEQRTEVAVLRRDVKEASLGTINASFLSSCLRYNLRPVDFATKVVNLNETRYEYITSTEGPVLVRETTEQKVTPMEFAAGMNVPDYVKVPAEGGSPYVYYIPTYQTYPAETVVLLGNDPNLLITTRTIVTHQTIQVQLGDNLTRTKTRTKTSRWISRGLSQEGQQEFQWALKGRPDNDVVPGLVEQFRTLRFEGTELQTSDGRPAVPTRPSPQELAGSTLVGDSGNQHTVTGTVQFTAGQGSNDVTTTATYDMPFTPDDINDAGIAQAAALAFGLTESALEVGHAYGYNVVTSFERAPSLPLSPVYVRLAGLEASFLTDAISYAFDATGIVVSSDLMLLGATGYYGASPLVTSWARLPVPANGLLQAATPTVESAPAKANTIAYPSGFDPVTPSSAFASLGTTGTDVYATWTQNQQIIAPVLQRESATLWTRPSISLTEYEYPLTLDPEVAELSTGPESELVWLTQVVIPSAEVLVAALAPSISTGVRVSVPAAATQLATLEPLVVSGASVAVPAAAVSVAAVAPDMVGRLRKEVLIPAADITMAALVPGVFSGGSIAVPAVDVALAGAVPVVGESDRYWSNVSLLLHMDGANNSTTFTDSSSNNRTATASGNAVISTAQSKFGTASGLLDGNGDYITIPGAGGFGTGDFTVELWVRPNTASTQSYGRFIQCGNYGGGGDWQLARNSLAGNSNPMAPMLDFLAGTFRLQSATTLVDNAWSHLAFSRQGTTVRLFINGNQVASGTSSANLSQTTVVVGADSTGANAYAGYVDDVRVTVGVARYTASFTPPTKAFLDR